jgi:hypothetical protein
MSEIMTNVNKQYLDKLEGDAHLLECLDACGVSDWNGFDKAYQMYTDECVPIGEHKIAKDRVKLGLSPSCKVEEWDCRK